jgi:hypothetical protein
MKSSDPVTAFRLPQGILAAIDDVCAKEDLTRSQIFRRSVMLFLKGRYVDVDGKNGETPSWPAEPFERQH